MTRTATLVLVFLVTLTGCVRGGDQRRLSGPPIRILPDKTSVTSVAFGSCLRQNRPAPIFATIAAQRPDVFVFLGDNIYGDTEDVAVFRAKYRQLAAQPGFLDLRKNSTVLAIWDDHDFGENDAGRDYPMQQLSKSEFLDFWSEPRSSPRRSRPGNYSSWEHGPQGQRVQILLLDTRSFRDPLAKLDKPGPYGPYTPHPADSNLSLLGAEQWAWLEVELKKPADLRIIASSIQLLANEHNFEKWGNFPAERDRLLNLIGSNPTPTLVLSGDRHSGELSRLSLPSGKRTWDLTASALNQGSGLPKEEPNTLRVGPLITEPHYGWIDIDWSAKSLRLQLRRESGSVLQDSGETFTRLKTP
jgi:alkaline phosphatase D